MAYSPFLSNCGNLDPPQCVCVCVSLKQFSETHLIILFHKLETEGLSDSNQCCGYLVE